MPTVGNTAKPATFQEAWGLNTNNQQAQLQTMPSGGPWLITKLGGWLAGWDENADYKLCLWSAAGTLLRSGATGTLAAQSLALGNCVQAVQTITAYECAGGTQFYVGWSRDPNDNLQFGKYSSGTHLDDTALSWPSDLSGFSSHGGGAISAYIADYELANSAPNAPVSLNPSGDEVVNTGRTITFSGVRSDPDSGDYISQYEIAIYTDGLTKIYSAVSDPTGAPTSFSRAITLPSGYYAGNSYYRWRARTRDSANVWGPWSGYARFRPNSVPNTPSAPTIETDTLTPVIQGSFSDPDPSGTGSTIAGVDFEVTRATSPYTAMWTPSEIAKSASPWTVTYAGTALSWGVSYRCRYRVKDGLGAWSGWSAYRTWTPVQPVGPSNMTPRTTATRQTTLTPTLTVGHSANFRNEEIQVRASASDSGTLLWSKTWDGVDYANTLTKARTYAGTALAWGSTYYWKSRIELSDGTITAWSPYFPFYINALPTAPVISLEDTVSGLPAAIRPSDGMLIISDSTPLIRAPFTDPDVALYGDAIGARSIEVRRADTQAAHTGFPLTTGTTDNATIGTALTADLTYEVRVGYRDNAGQPAGTYSYSAWKQFRYSLPPTAALTAPAGGSTVTDSSPLLDWTFTGSGGKTQRSYRIEIFDKGPTGANFAEEEPIYDSGTILSSATAHELPIGTIPNGHDFRWQVTVEDTDGLTFVLT
jgi:hypothetical protein